MKARLTFGGPIWPNTLSVCGSDVQLGHASKKCANKRRTSTMGCKKQAGTSISGHQGLMMSLDLFRWDDLKAWPFFSVPILSTWYTPKWSRCSHNELCKCNQNMVRTSFYRSSQDNVNQIIEIPALPRCVVSQPKGSPLADSSHMYEFVMPTTKAAFLWPNLGGKKWQHTQGPGIVFIRE